MTTVPFISWACRCGASGNIEASKPDAKYRQHRGRFKKGAFRVRPGHGLTEYVIFDQLVAEAS